PIQKPHPPIIFGGESDAALRRVGDLGQGWFGFNLLPDEARARIEVLARILTRRGRDPESVEITVSPYLKPGSDRASLEAYARAGVDQVVFTVAGRSGVAAVRNIKQLAAELLETAHVAQRGERTHV